MSDTDTTESTNSTTATENGFTAPYTSFLTLSRLIEQMAEEGGAPSRLDRSYLQKIPGGAQTIFLASCKSLGLIDDDMHPTSTLEALIDASGEQRKALMGDLVQKYYAGPLSLSERATQQQLEEEFRKLGVTGSTLRKAISFYLNICRYAGISYSSNFKLPKIPSNATRAKRKAADPKPAAGTDPVPEDSTGGRADLPTLVQGLVEKLPAEGAQWTATEAKAWLDIAKLTFPFVYGYKDGGPDS
jgi:Family of unknown function (DUF5343)